MVKLRNKGNLFSSGAWLLAAALFISTAWIDPYHDKVKEGNREFGKKDFKKAEDHYRAASGYAPGGNEKNKLRFNLGDAKYMEERYDQALEDFRAALQSDDLAVQKKALFNAGNVYYKKGETAEAVRSYINALKIDPAYGPAKKNLEYIFNAGDQSKQGGNEKKSGEGRDRRDMGKGGRKDRGQSGRNNASDGKPELKNKGQLSEEQVMNIIKSMKNKPVRRDRGTGEKERVLEKSW